MRHVRNTWSASPVAVAVGGLSYLLLIALWLSIESTPREPIADPYLAWDLFIRLARPVSGRMVLLYAALLGYGVMLTVAAGLTLPLFLSAPATSASGRESPVAIGVEKS